MEDKTTGRIDIMNRREFIKIATAVAGGLSVPISTWPPKNYSEARDEIKRTIIGIVTLTAGAPIRAGQAVYIADDGLAYAAK